jgi:hypothetical protein
MPYLRGVSRVLHEGARLPPCGNAPHKHRHLQGPSGADQAAAVRPMLTRHQIEDEIERLIGLLDAMEPDPDLEDAGDAEPWLGAAEADRFSNRGWNLAPSDEREDEGALDNEDLSNCADDMGPSYPADTTERNRVTDSIVVVNAQLRVVMARHGLSPVPALHNIGGAIWGR